jgi:hypothetical protein
MRCEFENTSLDCKCVPLNPAEGRTPTESLKTELALTLNVAKNSPLSPNPPLPEKSNPYVEEKLEDGSNSIDK